jgi:hypothetical protein
MVPNLLLCMIYFIYNEFEGTPEESDTLARMIHCIQAHISKHTNLKHIRYLKEPAPAKPRVQPSKFEKQLSMDPQSSSAEHLDDSPTATAHSKRKRRPIVAAVNQRPTKHRKSIPLHRPDPSTEDHDPEQFATSRLTLSFTKKDTTNDFIGTKPHSHAPLLVRNSLGLLMLPNYKTLPGTVG